MKCSGALFMKFFGMAETGGNRLNKKTVKNEAEKLLQEANAPGREEIRRRYHDSLSKDQIDRIYYHYCYLRGRKEGNY